MQYELWVKDWLEIYIRPNKKFGTCRKYQNIVNNHLVPNLGVYDMDELLPDVLQRFVVNLLKSGLASNTVNAIVSVLKSSLNQAAFLRKVENVYTDKVVRPKRREKKVESFTRNEQRALERFVAHSPKLKYLGVIICLYTGLRIGELLALTWEDVNLKKSILYVNKTCRDSWVKGKYVKEIDTTKTETSTRLVPIPRQILPYFKILKRNANSNYVIYAKSRYGVGVRSYQKSFSSILVRLNMDHRGFHSLRHTFATRALESGMDIKTLADVLGHRNPSVTLKRYAHSMLDHKKEMMNKLGEIMLR